MSIEYSALDDRLDRLINIDVGGRGVEHLCEAARALQKTSLVGAAADALLSIPEKATVLVTTGSVSRAWISTAVGENDGPAGAAVIVRALVLARHAHCVVVIEDTLAQAMAAVLTSAGPVRTPRRRGPRRLPGRQPGRRVLGLVSDGGRGRPQGRSRRA